MCSNPSNAGTLIDNSEDRKGNACGSPGTEWWAQWIKYNSGTRRDGKSGNNSWNQGK